MRRALKITLWILGSLILLVLLAGVFLNSYWGQNIVRGRAEVFLRDKLKTQVRIGFLGVGFPKSIVIRDVLLLDKTQDTLLALGELRVNISMLALLSSKIDVQQVLLSGVHAHIYRKLHDTDFNFTYIINAFAGKPRDTTIPRDTTSKPLAITVGKVQLTDIHARFDDYTGGTRMAVDLNQLELSMKKLDLDKMLFHVGKLTVDGLSGSFIQDTSWLPATQHTGGKADLQLIADDIDLQKIAFSFSDKQSKLSFTTRVGALQLQVNKFGLSEQLIDIKTLAISSTDFALLMGTHPVATHDTGSTPSAIIDEGWHLRAGDIDLSGVHFRMDDESAARIPKGIDYAHLNLREVAVKLHDAKYDRDSLSGTLRHLAAKEQSGVQVNEMRAHFSYNLQGAVLDQLYLETPNTTLQDHLEVHYHSLASLKDSLKAMNMRVDLVKSTIAVSDILLFVPELETQKMFGENRNASIRLETKFNGRLDKLDINRFHLAGLRNTEILLSGRIAGLPDADKISYDINIAKFLSSSADLSTFVPDSVLSFIRIPDGFGIAGTVSGTIRDYKANLNIASTDGLAQISGRLAMSPGKGREQYDMAVSTAQLNVGRILKQDSVLGAVSARFVAKGTGFDPKVMNAVVDGNILSAMIMGYRYHDISLYGKMAAQKGDIDMIAADPNLRMQLKGHADFSGKYVAALADIRMDSIDFQALKLYSSELRASGTIHADFPELNPEYPRGSFVWWQPVINAGGKRFYLDSLYVLSNPSADSGQNIVADLGVLHASVTGRIPLTGIAPAIKEHISRHYNFDTRVKPAQDTGKVQTVPEDYSLNVAVDVADKPMLRSILPGLTSFDSIRLRAHVTSRVLSLDLLVPDLVYGTTAIEGGSVKVRATDSAFTYDATVDRISQDKFSLWATNVNGKIDQDTITVNVSISDAARQPRFVLAADIQKAGDSQVIHLRPGLMLDYRDWQVAQPNRIVLAGDGFYIHNFGITDNGQHIGANSAQPVINAPLKVDITNFKLSNITQALSSSDTLLASGLLGGYVNVEQFKPGVIVSGDLQIVDLSLLGDTVGNLRLQVNNKQENTLDAKVRLAGNGNDIALEGAWYLKTKDGNDFNFNADVNAVSMRSIEALTMHHIKNSSGFLRGKLSLQGTVKAPVVRGTLQTDNFKTTVSMLNATFKMPSEKITFTGDAVTFNNFIIRDENDNKATLNGGIDIRNLSDLQMDMKLRANKWRALHSTEKDNKTFYGDLLLTTNLNVKGTPTAPLVDGTINILKGTKVTVVNPESNPEIESRKGIVRFVNMKDTGRRNVLVPKITATAKVSQKKGSDINVNITVDKEAEFSLIIDKSSGDFLTVKGDANINASVTPGGTIGLTGSYALTDGAYQLNYNLVKRRFRIAQGSMITFAGDPVKGTILDVTAVYEAQVSPYDLVQRQVADVTQLNYYKQRLPFDVKLFMNGPILTPRLTFDIVLPESKANKLSADQIDLVQGKLSQVRTDTSELNKQVFAILILNRFVSDDPFSSGAGSSASFTALQSVSTFIGEQLNRAAGKLVKGVDFSVDLATTEDYTSGSLRQRTDLNLAASKQLLNDRLKLTLGNNFELDGPQSGSGNSSSFVPSNLAADYLLSADGKYTLRGYRRAYDVGVLQGFVTETGLNFIVSYDYNKIRSVFRKQRKRDTGEGADERVTKEGKKVKEKK